MAVSTMSKANELSKETLAKIQEKLDKLRSERQKSGKAVASAVPSGAASAFVQAASWQAWTYNGQCGVTASISTLGPMNVCTISATSLFGGVTYAYVQGTVNPPSSTAQILAIGSSALPQAGTFVTSTITGSTGTGSFSYTTQCYVYNVYLDA